MATPLQLSDDEMTVLLALAEPIEQKLRPEFPTELEVSRQAGEIGQGSVHRVARQIQRRYYGAPILGESKYRV